MTTTTNKSRVLIEDWQISLKSIQERSAYLVNNVLWSDCTFLVGTEDSITKEFEAHKLILSMTSPVFATMFHGGLPEMRSPIKIVDIQPDAFKSMLEYIYTDTINVSSVDQACELCYAAKKYMLPHLLKQCMEFIWRDVDTDTALRAYEFAKLFDDNEIAEKSIEIIRNKTTDVLSKSGSTNICSTTLSDILDQDYLNVPTEIYMFNFLQSWIVNNVERTENEEDANKIRLLGRKAMEKIRFLAMEATEFADGPAQCDFLTKDESFALLLNISSHNSKYPLPATFCTKRNPRKFSKKINKFGCRKFYVRRPIIEASVQLNNGCLTDKFIFVTSRDITLLGIQISSQLMNVLTTSLEDTHLFNVPPNTDRDDIEIPEGNIQSGETSSFSASSLMPKSKYRELLIMFVREVNDAKNNWFTHVTSLVEHDSILNILLTIPATIRAGIEYELTVTLNKEGYYLMGNSNAAQEVVSDDVKFTIIPSSDTNFVSSLIFTR